jgi:hypothetical protein
MRRLKINWILIFLAFAFMRAQSQAQEPVRAGIDVPEPKLIKKGEIDYPAQTWLGNAAGAVVLSLLIDEHGSVIKATLWHSDADFIAAAESVVKEWQFTPTFINGRAVQVLATVIILYAQRQTSLIVDLEPRTLILSPVMIGYFCDIPAKMDRFGNLKKEPNKSQCKSFYLIPNNDVPFSQIEKLMKRRSKIYILHSPRYRFPDWEIENAQSGIKRLYYSALISSSESQIIQLACIDPDVEAPKLDIDFARLAESLKDSNYPNGAIYFFTIYVDERGNILCLECPRRDEAAKNLLSEARVLSPGTRNGKPVPTAVVVAIPVK